MDAARLQPGLLGRVVRLLVPLGGWAIIVIVVPGRIIVILFGNRHMLGAVFIRENCEWLVFADDGHSDVLQEKHNLLTIRDGKCAMNLHTDRHLCLAHP